jgi:hypothetical protein
MQIVYHIGAHCTDQESLHASLVKNNEMLVQKRVAPASTPKYQNINCGHLKAKAAGSRLEKTRLELLADILGNTEADRAIFTNGNFIRVPNRIFENEVFYMLAVEKLQAFGTLFSDHDIEISICIRDPESFIPAAFGELHGRSYDRLTAGTRAEVLQWHGLIDQIRATLPNVKITTWCNKNIPFIWPKLLCCVMWLTDEDPAEGGYDLITSALTQSGTQNLQNYFKANPPALEKER